MDETPAVLVVGAGPTGLMLASELTRRRVPCRIVDAHPGPMHWDRATVVHPRSLELFDSLGLAGQLLAVGTPQRGAKVRSGGDVIAAFDLVGCGSRYEFSLGVSEEVTEAVLTDHLHRLGGEVERSTRVLGLARDADGVQVTLDRDGAREEIDVAWVVGCDGLHSATREAIGVAFDGHDIASPWAVFDATLDAWDEVYDLTFVYLEQVPVILTALPERRWRVYLRPNGDESDLVADAMSTLHGYHPGVSFVAVDHPTRFRCHSMVATAFRSGRVLLAGDAAHVCSPAQGHGMNTGLQDAANLAWKLALVHHGAAEHTLLDSYEAERRPVATRVAAEGDAFEQAQSVGDPAERDARDRRMRAEFADSATRHHEAVAEAELDVEYTASPVVAGDHRAPLAPGHRLPDTVPVAGTDGAVRHLHELATRAGQAVFVLTGPDADAAPAELVAALDDVVARSPRFEGPVEAGHVDAASAEILGTTACTLLAVRPDGYVGLRTDHDHVDALTAYDELVRTGRP